MTSPRHPMSPARTSPRRRRHQVAALLAAGALTLSACDGGQSVLDPSDPQDTSEGATLSRTSPLTGEVLRRVPGHPILAVKVDNSGSNRQIGLGKADMVVEELVEGGITRLATFYYSSVPSDVGPVRSIRATDIGIVAPLNAVLVASGAAPPTAKRVRKADIRTITEKRGRGFYRGAGAAPYNLFVDMDKVVGPMKPVSSLPETYLPFGDQALPKGKPAKRFTAVFSPASDSTFQLRGRRYVNVDGYARGRDFVADSVLVLRVRVGLAGYRDPSGAPVPETKFTGKGAATIFNNGRMISGTWLKKGLSAPLRLRARGEDLQIPPGKVRIELVPDDTGALRIG